MTFRNLWDRLFPRTGEDVDKDSRPAGHTVVEPRLTGRDAHLRRLDEMITRHRVVAVHGVRGSGKTALVMWWAKRARSRFPDGCLYADLNGMVGAGQAEAVLTAFLTQLNVSLGSVRPEDLLTLFRSVTQTKRVLVVLDNASSAAQVGSLLPAQGNGFVVTSRDPIKGLQDAGVLAVEPLSAGESRLLLERLGGVARVTADPAATLRVIELCGRLPLALHLAGMRLTANKDLTMAQLAEALDDAGHSGSIVTVLESTLSTAMETSYDALSGAAARTFRLLGAQPCQRLHLYAVAALTGTDVPATRAAVDELVRYNLVVVDEDTVRLQSALRDYAASRATMGEESEATDRLIDWYAAMARSAGDALATRDWAGDAIAVDTEGLPLVDFATDSHPSPLTWFHSEFDSALALVEAVKDRESSAWRLPVFFLPYLFLTKRLTSCLRFLHLGVRIARRTRHRVGLARCLHGYSWVLHELDRDEEALPLLYEAMELHRGLHDGRGRAWTAFALGESLTATKDFGAAMDYFDQALEHFGRERWQFGRAVVLFTLAVCYERQGAGKAAFAAAENALQISKDLGIVPLEGMTRHQLGLLHQREGDPRKAINHFEAALALRQAMGERWGAGDTLLSLGETFAGLGRFDEAYAAFDESLSIFAELHDDARRLVVQTAMANLDVTPRPE